MSEEYRDKHGRQIHPGDLLKTYHYTGARRKRHYLYHTAVMRDDGLLWMVPTSHLEPTRANNGGDCRLRILARDGVLNKTEIVAGYGPEPYLSYEDRPKRPTPDAARKSVDERDDR